MGKIVKLRLVAHIISASPHSPSFSFKFCFILSYLSTYNTQILIPCHQKILEFCTSNPIIASISCPMQSIDAVQYTFWPQVFLIYVRCQILIFTFAISLLLSFSLSACVYVSMCGICVPAPPPSQVAKMKTY